MLVQLWHCKRTKFSVKENKVSPWKPDLWGLIQDVKWKNIEQFITYAILEQSDDWKNIWINGASWEILQNPINSSAENIEKFVKAIVILHNYLPLTENASYCPADFGDFKNSKGKSYQKSWIFRIKKKNFWIIFLQCLDQQDVLDMRISTKDYVKSPICKLDWQLDHVRRTYFIL